jgi:hypothetical protein
MRAPSYESGQGARRLCATCGLPISIKSTGRTRRFCSDRCQGLERRKRNFASKMGRYTGDTENPDFSSTKSATCKGTLADPRFPESAPLVGFGLGLGRTAQPSPSDLIRKAIALELAARWRVVPSRSRR